MPWLHTGVTQFHEQLALLDMNRAIKGLVLYYVLWLEYVGGSGPLLWPGWQYTI